MPPAFYGIARLEPLKPLLRNPDRLDHHLWVDLMDGIIERLLCGAGDYAEYGTRSVSALEKQPNLLGITM